jgi:NADH-quinone oxidoreductase subunit L
MFLACGVGAFWVAIFHLYTHAFFKALLFLGSGSVIHSLSGEQDMRKMGALKGKIPITYKTMLIGSLAIAGIPGLAGFFSKDEILWQSWSSHHQLLWVLGFATAGMTAFYMFRLMFMTFGGESRVEPEAAHHVHESPRTMTVPLMVLAVGSILAGWIGTPVVFGPLHEALPSMEHWLSPAIAAVGGEHAAAEHHDTTMEWVLMFASVALAIGGILYARKIFDRKLEGEPMRRLLGPAQGLFYNKYFVDEIYNALFVNGLVKGGGARLSRFDSGVVDGAVNGAGWLTRFTSTVSIWWDTWIVDGLVRLTAFTVKFISYPVRMLQTGLVQNYAFFIVIGALGLLAYFVAR